VVWAGLGVPPRRSGGNNGRARGSTLQPAQPALVPFRSVGRWGPPVAAIITHRPPAHWPNVPPHNKCHMAHAAQYKYTGWLAGDQHGILFFFSSSSSFFYRLPSCSIGRTRTFGLPTLHFLSSLVDDFLHVWVCVCLKSQTKIRLRMRHALWPANTAIHVYVYCIGSRRCSDPLG
jgi:hypothetical protein